MAETTPVAMQATLPSPDDIERASSFTREPFLSEGEDAASVLAPGTAHRRAFDAALAEMDAGNQVPSVAWRRQFSLLLGLERLLSEDEPSLVDGTVLSAHQVDALSGTLTALFAEAQRNGSGNGTLADAEAVLAPVGIPGEEDIDDDDEPEEPQDWDEPSSDDEDQLAEAPEDPNAGKRFWFEHATGAGKTVAALGFVEASRTGGVLILTHRRNLVDQFHGELRDRGYAKRIAPALLKGQDRADGPVTVETYQWFVRNAGRISDSYAIVICDEAHTALGEKTSGSIRQWAGPIFIGMTATGALIARHVTDLFPTQTSRFDLAQAARRGVISPLRCVRIPPGPGVRTIAKVPLRRGEVDTEFDQEMLAELLDQLPFNLAVADLYNTRFNGVPGVVYAAGVRHAYNVAQAFRDVGLKAQAVSGETPKRELASILARYERGDVDVLVNAQLLAEGWNSPRATVCMHLAPTASKRIYQQRVGRVTRRQPGKEAGIVVDFVHPATKHDDPVVTLHSLLDRDVYRGGAIVVGPVRRGRGRRLRVERRVLPVTADENRRIEVFERELWRIAVEHLDYGEQVQWAALAGARVAPNGWRRARAMLHFDQGGELKRTFLTTAVERNKNPQLRLKALQEIASGKDAEAFDRALDFVETWPRDDKREGVKVVLQALAEKRIGRRDQANNWIWRCANMTRDVHEEYAVQRWPETKRLLGLLVNSSGGAHARNARRLVHAARQQDRRLAAALLAAALPHTAEAGEVINGARTRMSRKPAALARELLRNFPKARGKSKRRRRRKQAGEAAAPEVVAATVSGETVVEEVVATPEEEAPPKKPARAKRAKAKAKAKAKPRAKRAKKAPEPAVAAAAGEPSTDSFAAAPEVPAKPAKRAKAKAKPRAKRAKPAPPELPEAARPPKKPRAKRAKKAPEPNLLEAASERVRAAVREATERSAGDEAA
jgi:ribonuclease E